MESENFDMNLTRPQKLIYDMEKYAGGAISVLCGVMLRKGTMEVSQIRGAVNLLYRKNDALRIRITENADGAVQRISEYVEQDYPVLHFRTKAELDAYAESYAQVPFDLYDSLSEITIAVLPDQYGLLVKLHHLVGDAWSFSLLGTQFNRIMNGQEIEAFSYADYVEDEKEYLESSRYEKSRTYFLEQFRKCDEVTYLSEKPNHTPDARRKTFVINREKTLEINQYARKNASSAFMVFTAALSVYMNRIKMNAERFFIGTAVLNRKGNRENNTLGMFVNTVPLLIELDNQKSFAENLAKIGTGVFSVFRHQKFNYGDVLAAVRREFGFTEKLYDVLISYQNAAIIGADVETIWYSCGSQNESLQIHIDDRDSEGIFRIHYDYQTDKFTEHEIERLHQHICALLEDALSDDNKKIYELNILPEEERNLLLKEFNNTAVRFAEDKCVHQLFEEQAAETPDKTAVIATDGTLTYDQLNRQANRIAHSLRREGIGSGDLVIYTLTRKSYLLAAVFGILKSGAAYVPIAPDYPPDRIEYMRQDCKARYVITEENIGYLLSCPEEENLDVPVSTEDLCYCIYTSGSTGNPKGVMIRHRNVVNYVSENPYNVVNVNINHQQTTIAAITTCGFDIFVTETLLPLADGFTIVLADEIQSKDQTAFNDLMEEHPADVIQTTPTKFKLLLADESHRQYLDHVESIILGGEALEESFVSELRQLTHAHIYNNYGPTETTVWSTLTEVDSDDITIGKPIANTQVYILDNYLQPVPVGTVGELCIAGDGVGAGYLNRPELTAEKFIDNPFGSGKLYRTGDLAFFREDGNLQYIGRNDFQVKIRGLRIELGEIENVLCGIEGIQQAVVVVRKNSAGRQIICAFYTGTETDPKVLRTVIGKKLPKYMIPHIFCHLDALPMTSSGKVNRKALPEIDLELKNSAEECVLPTTPMEKKLCALMETVLGTSPVGITDDFFDLGGDSLKAIELVSAAHRENIYFTLQNVYDYPAVGALCEFLRNGDAESISYEDIDFSGIHPLLEGNRVENIVSPQKCEVGNLLLAGATGYLGIHILDDFLRKDTGTAYCLVRGQNPEVCRNRLMELLCFYFGSKYEDMNRIEVVCADLQKERLGLTEENYSRLLKTTDTVINCAASVKHYGSYQYFYDANVVTTKNLIEFCKQSGAKLIHTSTLSVSGNSFADDFGAMDRHERMDFAENNLYIGQPLGNVYARSKFEAEKAVFEAMADGVQANIMRMGNLTNRMTDGVFQKNYESNAFLKRLKAVLDLKAFPDYLLNLYAEFTPVDEASAAVMTLVRHFSSEFNTFHINSPKVVYLDKLIEFFRSFDFEMTILDEKMFGEALKNKEDILASLINDMDENSRLNYDSSIHILNDFTVQYLRQFGFEWSEIDRGYLERYVEYFRKIGFLAQRRTSCAE